MTDLSALAPARAFSARALEIDPEAVAGEIAAIVREQVLRRLRRRGIVVGLSGGVDSSVVAALAVRALGREHVFGLFTPEQDSEPDSLRLGRLVAETLGIQGALEDITPMLAAAGCYRRRDEFIREVFPEYTPEFRCKLVLPDVLAGRGYNVHQLVIESPDGTQHRARPPLHVALGIVAATNMKQRARKQIEYYHADRLNYAVAGTPNRLEYDQGFFVKLGDGAADVKPIAALYKTQVYALARHLGVPEEISRRPPTTDTYSLPQGQDEFYFSLDYRRLDLLLWAKDHGLSPEEAAPGVDLPAEHVRHVYEDIERKRRAAEYLHAPPLVLDAGLDGGAATPPTSA
jgi:NAD+ synthase